MGRVGRSMKKLNVSVNKSIIVRSLIAVIVLLLVVIFLRKVCNFDAVTEMFTSYKRCEQVPIKGLYRQILEEEGVNVNVARNFHSKMGSILSQARKKTKKGRLIISMLPMIRRRRLMQ